MGRVRYNHLRALITPLTMIGANQFQPGQFAMCAGHRLQRHRIHPGDLRQHGLQIEHQLQCPLRVPYIFQRVQSAQRRHGGDIFIDFWIILHGAGAQRIKARIHAKRPL